MTGPRRAVPHTTQEHDIFVFDFKKAFFISIRLYKGLLLTCLVFSLFVGYNYLFFRKDYYAAEVTLKMADQPLGSAYSALLAGLNAGENTASRIESVTELFSSKEYSHLLMKDALLDRKFLMTFADMKQLKPAFLKNRGLAAQTEGDEDMDEENAERFEQAFGASLNYRADEHRNRLTVVALTRSPWVSSRLAELAGKTIVELNYKRKTAQIAALKKFLSKQIEDINSKLTEYETELAKYQRAHGFYDLTSMSNPVFLRYKKAQEEIEEVKHLMATNADRISDHERDLSTFRTRVADPNFYKANVYLTQLQYQMRSLAYEYDLAKAGESAANSPEKIKSELEALSLKYHQAVTGQNESALPVTSPTEYYQTLENGLMAAKKERTLLTGRLNRAETELNSLKPEADSLPDQLREIATLQRNITLNSKILAETQAKLQEVQFLEVETLNDLSILSVGNTPAEPADMPEWRVMLIMAMLGLAIGGLIIFWREVFAQTVRTERDMNGFCDKVVGAVPTIVPAHGAGSGIGHKNPLLKMAKRALSESLQHRHPATLILDSYPDGQDADNLRSLRMHLLKYIREDEIFSTAPKVIMITGVHGSSGRTFIAANLALTLAKADAKVLLIDLDLRSPGLHKFFPRLKPADASKAFFGDLESIVQKYSDYLDVVLTQGQALHPPEILEAHFIKDNFQRMREKYDYIIFDTPAVLDAVDPTISAMFADLVVMTAEAAKTTRVALDRAVQKIHGCNDRPIYGILNFSDRRRDAIG